MNISQCKDNKKIYLRGCKKGYALSILLIALLVISITIIALLPVFSKRKDSFANTSTYVKECVENQSAADLTTTACSGAITGLTRNNSKDYESVMYYLNNATYTSTVLNVVKASCDNGGNRACDILLNRCSADSTQCDIGGSSNDLANYINILSSDNSNLGKVYLASRGADYYLHRMNNLNTTVKAVCNSNMATTACDIAATSKTRTYNFNTPQRADFFEADNTKTNFHDGIVDLVISSSAGVSYDAYGWGRNDYGQIGNNAIADKYLPTATSGGLKFTQISSYYMSTCGLTSSGTAYCWGNNVNGQLGDNTTIQKNIPTEVKDTSGNLPGLNYSQIAAGQSHTCGIQKTTGAAYCWGYNSSGQLGDNTTTNKLIPTAVTGGLVFNQITAGWGHTCGLTSSGAAYCWGNNVNGSGGQLGDNTVVSKSVPTEVKDASGNLPGLNYSQISAAGFHTCGLQKTTGAVYCWGYNAYGQLGDGSNTQRNIPKAINDGRTYSKIMAGYLQTCGIEAGTNKAYCWGYNNVGQLGDNSYVNRSVPTAVSGGLTFSDISLAENNTCALTSSGTAYCWGKNNYGQLGINTSGSSPSGDKLVPTAVLGGLTFAQIEPGTYSTSALQYVNPVIKSYFTTTNNNQITNIVGGIQSFNMIYTQPAGTNLLGLVSFDGRANWKKWNGAAWVAATNNLSTYNFTTAGNANTPAEIQTGLTNLTTGGGTLDFAFYLETDSTGQVTPSIDKFAVNYLQER